MESVLVLKTFPDHKGEINMTPNYYYSYQMDDFTFRFFGMRYYGEGIKYSMPTFNIK